MQISIEVNFTEKHDSDGWVTLTADAFPLSVYCPEEHKESDVKSALSGLSKNVRDVEKKCVHCEHLGKYHFVTFDGDLKGCVGDPALGDIVCESDCELFIADDSNNGT